MSDDGDDARPSQRWPIRSGPSGEPGADTLASEAPLEVRLNSVPIAVVMRSPGQDEDLALGFLIGEGLITEPTQVERLGPASDDGGEPLKNTMRVIAKGVSAERLASMARRVFATSSCGICGRASLERVHTEAPPAAAAEPLDPALITSAMAELRRRQELFSETGGTHAALIVDRRGTVRAFAEDIGRHNAVDKVIGRLARAGIWPLHGHVLFLSGRVAFELVQKAAMAGIAGIVAVGAPTTMAADLALLRGLVLVGFVRDGRWTLYSGTVSGLDSTPSSTASGVS